MFQSLESSCETYWRIFRAQLLDSLRTLIQFIVILLMRIHMQLGVCSPKQWPLTLDIQHIIISNWPWR